MLGAAYADRGLRGAAVIGAVLVVPNAVTQMLKIATAEDRVRMPHTSAVHVDAGVVAQRARDGRDRRSPCARSP